MGTVDLKEKYKHTKTVLELVKRMNTNGSSVLIAKW